MYPGVPKVASFFRSTHMSVTVFTFFQTCAPVFGFDRVAGSAARFLARV